MLTRGKKTRDDAKGQSDRPKKNARKDDMAGKRVSTRIAAKGRATVQSYRHIREGDGGTYTIQQDRPYIGTDRCNTCLGIYFAIDEDRCFCAHVNIEPRQDDGEPFPTQLISNYEVNTAAERSIIWWLKRKLTSEAWSEDWGNITQLMRDSLVIVCPTSNHPGKQHVGDAALMAVKEFLGMSNSEIQPERAEGFVVTHSGRAAPEVVYFPAQRAQWNRRNEAHGSDGETPYAWSGLYQNGSVWTEDEDGQVEGPYHKHSA